MIEMLRRTSASIALPLFILFCQATISQSADTLKVASPNGRIQVTVELDRGAPSYSVARDGRDILKSSRLGFRLVDAEPLADGFKVADSQTQSVDQPWQQPWGEARRVECKFNELRLTLKQQDPLARRMVIVFRVFDDGLGFRYEWPEQKNLRDFQIADELTEFNFAEDAPGWWIPAYEREHYEYLYRHTSVSDIPVAHTPATFEFADGPAVSIHEAALVDFSSMSLRGSGTSKLKADLAPWSDGVKVKATAPHRSPWRTIQIADGPAGLIESHLILNLNEPSKLTDTSWIKPGKYVGIWWEMHLNKSTWATGEKHGATTANTKRYVDFAAANGFDGVLVEGWNRGWDGDWIADGDKFDFTHPVDDYDLEALSQYARQRGVRLIGHNETGGASQNYETQLTDAFDLYQQLGIRAVKTGYVNFANELPRFDVAGNRLGEWHYGQFMVRHHQRVVDEAARHQIMLDVHEPAKQTGLRRTYPNLMTAEGARGQEYNAWSADGGNPPEHETILPFTRLLAGPMDYTPGIFKITYPEYRPDNRVNTTLAKQLALYVVLYSPLHMAADLPEHYADYDDAFQFIRDVPTDWDETCVLEAKIGDLVTIARRQRDGDDWYVGSVTDQEGRSSDLDLSFLDPNHEYLAEIYRDADDADWKTNPTAYTIETRKVDSTSTLSLTLAPGGGVAIRFHPLADSDAPRSANAGSIGQRD